MRLPHILSLARSISKMMIRKPAMRKFVLFAAVALPLFTVSFVVSARTDFYLFFKFCMQGTSVLGKCEDIDFDGRAWAFAEGQCVSDVDFNGPAIPLESFAFGACPGWMVINYAEVSGEYRDPGLDGSWFDKITQTGLVVQSGGEVITVTDGRAPGKLLTCHAPRRQKRSPAVVPQHAMRRWGSTAGST